MIPVHQTHLQLPLANCLQAAVASVLELPLDRVPNFALCEDMRRGLDFFLSGLGLQSLAVQIEPGDYRPAGYHLISGLSPRGDFYHVVVGYQGQAVHDPFPGGDCQLRTQEFHYLFVATLESNFRGWLPKSDTVTDLTAAERG